MIGLGPEDPMADICAYKIGKALSAGCKTFITEEEDILTNVSKELIKMPVKIGKRIFSEPVNLVKGLKKRVKHVKLPHVKLPHVKLPNVKLPNMKLPNVKLPNVKLPNAKFPDISRFKLPSAKLPDMSRFKLPHVKLPDISRLKLPDISHIKLPCIPKIKVCDGNYTRKRKRRR